MKIMCSNLGEWYINPMKYHVILENEKQKELKVLGGEIYVAIQMVAKLDSHLGMWTKLCLFWPQPGDMQCPVHNSSSAGMVGADRRVGQETRPRSWSHWLVDRAVFAFLAVLFDLDIFDIFF